MLTSFEINNFELVTFKTQPQGNVVDGWPISFSNIIEEHPSSEFLLIKISGVADKNVDFLSLNIVAHPFNNVVNNPYIFLRIIKVIGKVVILNFFFLYPMNFQIQIMELII